MAPAVSPVTTWRWLVTSDASTAERTGTRRSVPNSTWEVDGRLVVQEIVAPERVMPLAETPVTSGGITVGTTPGVMVVEIGVGEITTLGVRVGEAVTSTVGVTVLVRVGVRVGVGGSRTRVPTNTGATTIVAVGTTLAVGVTFAVGVSDAIGVADGVAVAVLVAVRVA